MFRNTNIRNPFLFSKCQDKFILKNLLARIFTEERNKMIPKLKKLKGYEAVKPVKTKMEFKSEFNVIANSVQIKLDEYQEKLDEEVKLKFDY